MIESNKIKFLCLRLNRKLNCLTDCSQEQDARGFKIKLGKISSQRPNEPNRENRAICWDDSMKNSTRREIGSENLFLRVYQQERREFIKGLYVITT